ncbi:MAG: type II toxin-antitoxin system RelE/ParE family toxin [Verrucomicrobiae bacterium]|nr:type II toxin-antitoxin system RelE/ParE family toxin [Verrucomicrobiae bacterium]
MRVRYDDEAFGEAMDAATWYETQREELARAFLAKWKEAELRMLADPEISRTFDGDLRQCRFDVFPYTLVYRIEDETTVQVVAVIHQHREPGYWRDRLDED